MMLPGMSIYYEPLPVISLAIFKCLKFEIEGRTVIGCALGPDLATVTSHDPMNDRQTEAGAWELRLGVHALKRAKQLIDIGRVKSGAVIPDITGPSFIPAKLHPRTF